MRRLHVSQLATASRPMGSARARASLLNRIGRGKWVLGKGLLVKSLRHLSNLRV